MFKQQLLNSIEKEINICRRLYTKIPPGEMNFRPKEGIRSILELLQYLSIIGSTMLEYWFKKDDTDFNTFFTAATTRSRSIAQEDFLKAMDEQKATLQNLFSQISEEDLSKKEVTFPWGGTVLLGEGIMATSIKWLAAYKLQLFLFVKLSGDQKLGTADAWVLTEIAP